MTTIHEVLDLPTPVYIKSGHVTLISGGYGTINSQSGLGIILESGTTVFLESGYVIDIAPPSGGQIGALTMIEATSGGIALASGAVLSMTVKAKTGNNDDLYVGFETSGQLPYSGYGFLLDPGQSWSFDIDEMGKVFVFAATSGDQISYGGVSK